MVKSMFAAVAGLRAHQTKMDVIGNNIANVNTYGYKAARATFSDSFYATTSGSSSSGATYGGTNPTQIGYGSKISSIDSQMTTGGTATTDQPLDCMITGNGFFLVGEKDDTPLTVSLATATDTGGDVTEKDELSALELTRVGNFSFDSSGYLVDSKGKCVYGFQTDTSTTPATVDLESLGPIRQRNIATAPEYKAPGYKSVSIGADGIITGTSSAGVEKIGQIALANVPNPNALERSEGGYYTAKNNTGTVTVNPSGQNGTAAIQSSTLEMSNVDLSKEFTEMITCQRGFQANTRIITVTDAMLEELVNMKR